MNDLAAQIVSALHSDRCSTDDIRKLLQGNSWTITIGTGQSTDAALDEACRRHLEARGYGVTEPGERWETPTGAAERLDVNPFTITKKIRKWEAMGHQLAIHRGPTERIIQFVSNGALDRFITESGMPLHPNAKVKATALL